jgi:hypothetical protein
MGKIEFANLASNLSGLLRILLTSLTFVVIGPLVGTQAAPMPGAGSSVLVAPEKGLFFSSRGFTLAAPTSWTLERAVDDKSNKDDLDLKDEFSVAYTHPDYPTAKLSVKTDTLRSEVSIESYAKKWMKDYSSYGFDVLSAKTFSTPPKRGLIVDLLFKKQGTQLRQVIYLRKKTAVTLTCVDQAKLFSNTMAGCNQIIQTFAWNNNPENALSAK